MTDNEKLARFQGKCYHVSDWGQTDCKYCGRTNDPRYFDFDSINPDYLNDDAAAMSLLDALVEKGYIWSLYGNRVGCLCKVCKMPDAVATDMQGGNNFREAVVAACLEVVRKEGV